MKEISTIILSGGGIRSISYCGVFRYLEKYNLHKNLKTICGVSSGSVFCLLYLLKYTSQDMEEEILSKNFKTLKHIQPMNILTSFGIDSGRHLMLWIESQVIKRGLPINITFQQLYDWNPVEFKIGVTNLTKQRFELLSYCTHPDLEVLAAIRMSISVPLVFDYCTFEDCIYIDGAVMNNYPIDFFDNNNNVLGFQLKKKVENSEIQIQIDTLDKYIYQIMGCVTNKTSSLSEFHVARTIEIYTNESIIDFGVTKARKKRLIQMGYECTEKYFTKNKE